jgi:hypothetical protein
MNRFRKHGFIDYNGRIRVHKSLLNVILHDESLAHNAVSAPLLSTPPPAKRVRKSKQAAASPIKQA